MSILQIVLIALGAVVVLLSLVVAVTVLRLRANLHKPIPVPVDRGARPVAQNLPVPGGSPGLTMDVFVPDHVETPPPLLVFVPGDGPEFLLRGARGWAMFRSYADIAACRGYAAALTTHRSSKNYKATEAMLGDVDAILRTLRGQAGELGFDPDQVVVWTFSGSAGPVIAHLLERPAAGVRALLSFYGFLDLTTFTLKIPEPVVERFSLPVVLGRLEALPCPVYLLHAGRDRKMMTVGFERVVALLEGKDLAVTTRVYAEGKHGFEVQNDPGQVRDEIDRAFAFIDDALGR